MAEPIYTIRENCYGSRKRLEWIARYVRPTDTAVEFGCGTGCMITVPFLARGYDIHGVDLDSRSIEFGRSVCRELGLDPNRLRAEELGKLDFMPAVVIASEVLEHITTAELPRVLGQLRAKIAPGGLLLVTVPNGYGWFELESFLWFKAGVGRVLETLWIPRIVGRLKRLLFGRDLENPYPNTLADDVSPHVQRFTLDSIRDLLTRHGFEVETSTGSVLFAGPFSNVLVTGVPWLMRLNRALGSRLPRIASGFYLVCRRPRW